MKVAILGFGVQGQSAYAYYRDLGCQITVCDQEEDLGADTPGADLRLGDGYLKDLHDFDVLVRTSSMPPEAIVAANGGHAKILEKVTTTSNEFLARVKTPVIAVTGTKGKGTTSMLSEALLKAAGLKVCLVGNIGSDALSFVREAQAGDVVVFEIASYQTLDLRYSPAVGVALGISPDHISWHGDFASYVAAKAQLFAHQKPDDRAVYFLGDSNSCRAVARTKATKIGYDVRDNPQAWVKIKDGRICIGRDAVMPVSQLALAGRHNLENVCAALAACATFLPTDGGQIARDVLRCFANPENRLEAVREVGGVRYINDAFSTNPKSTQAALEAVAGPKILILGGRSKGIEMEPLFRAILDSDIKRLIVVGPTGRQAAEYMRAQKAPFGIEESCRTMAEVVQHAAAQAEPGDTVLFSPGYASHDDFGNTRRRGRQFKEAVKKLG